jgi:hypothetical protein
LESGFRGDDFFRNQPMKNKNWIRLQTWPPQAILVSDWLISKKSSLKLSSQMNRNLVGST